MTHKKKSGYPAYKPALVDMWQADEEETVRDAFDIFNKQRLAKLAADVCVWEHHPEQEAYYTECNWLGPEENGGYKWCPFCGKKIKVSSDV